MLKNLLLSFLCISLCFSLSSADNQQIKVTRTNNLGLLPFIAQKENLFEKAEITAKVIKLQTGKMAMDSLISGDSEVATIVDSNIGFIGFTNPDIRVIAVLGTKLDDTVYFSKQSGIAKIDDLKGKRIGYIPATTSHLFLSRFLKRNNIAWNEIKPVVVQPLAMNTAFRDKIVDAVSIWQPIGYNIINEFGSDIGSFENFADTYLSYILLATTKQFLEKNRVLLKNFIGTMKSAQSYCQKNKPACDATNAPEIGVTIDAMPKVMEKFSFNVTAEPKIIERFNEIGKWIMETQENFADSKLPEYSKMVEFLSE